MNELVSIIVITYNSEKYVLDTLKSVKEQTFRNIELIISDDCSTDNTIAVCKQWLDENEKYFVNSLLITTDKNSGIPSNCNRGAKASQGQWIKFFAGDDLLVSSYIETLLKFALRDSSNVNIICSNNYGLLNDQLLNEKSAFESTPYFFKSITAKDQFQIALRIAGAVPALTIMIKRKLFYKVGGFDERYKYLEDYPFFLKINELGEKIYFTPEYLAYYRRHDGNVTREQQYIISPVYKNLLEVRFFYCRKYLPLIEKMGVVYEYLILNFILTLEKKYKKLSSFCHFLYRYQLFFNPFFLFRNLLKVIGREYKYKKYLNNTAN